MLKEKRKAPTVQAINMDGKPVSLSDYRGKVVVLYFYPKDDTPGCTLEAQQFRDYMKDIAKLGAVVIGVSKDSEKSHKKFTEKYDLNFPLWSDPDHKLMDAFGVWELKKFMGREYMGTLRATFIINKEGKVAKVFPKVTPKEHGKEVYEFLKKTQV